MVDMADFSSWVLERYLKSISDGKPDATLDEELKKELQATPVQKVCNASGINFCYPQTNDIKVRDLFSVLGRPGVHCVPIVNTFAEKFGRKHAEGFVTQSYALDFVANRLVFFGPQILNRKISIISGLVTMPVISVKEDNTLLDAFQALRNEKVSGMPVVDAAGDLVASISSRDFGFVFQEKFSSKQLSAKLSSFIQKSTDMASPELNKSELEKLSRPVDFQSSDTILQLIHKFQQHKTQRAYLTCPGEKKPIGVCSIGDLLRYLARTLPYPDVLTEKETEKRRVRLERQQNDFQKTEDLYQSKAPM